MQLTPKDHYAGRLIEFRRATMAWVQAARELALAAKEYDPEGKLDADSATQQVEADCVRDLRPVMGLFPGFRHMLFRALGII